MAAFGALQLPIDTASILQTCPIAMQVSQARNQLLWVSRIKDKHSQAMRCPTLVGRQLLDYWNCQLTLHDKSGTGTTLVFSSPWQGRSDRQL